MGREMGLRIAATIAMILALSACQGVKDQLGLNKQSPDEFRVVARAPLTLPPDFTLRPPEPGIPRPQEGTPTQQARKVVFRVDQTDTPFDDQQIEADGRSMGEASLLKAAGADEIDPNIRRIVDRETQAVNSGSEDFIEALIFWREEETPGVIVNAEEEAKRLRENAALGKPVTAGETPTIERRKKALFEDLF